MTSQNDRVALCHLRVSASDLYFIKANEGLHLFLCVFVVVRVGGGEGALIQNTTMQ